MTHKGVVDLGDQVLGTGEKTVESLVVQQAPAVIDGDLDMAIRPWAGASAKAAFVISVPDGGYPTYYTSNFLRLHLAGTLHFLELPVGGGSDWTGLHGAWNARNRDDIFEIAYGLGPEVSVNNQGLYKNAWPGTEVKIAGKWDGAAADPSSPDALSWLVLYEYKQATGFAKHTGDTGPLQFGATAYGGIIDNVGSGGVLAPGVTTTTQWGHAVVNGLVTDAGTNVISGAIIDGGTW